MSDFKTGLIIEKPKFTDWIAGGYTPLVNKIINPSGIFEVPEIEYQNSYSYDRMNCVTMSILNCLEVLYPYKTGSFINFSDRFLAKASGTTKKGNSMEVVFDTARNLGLVTEDTYPDTDGGWDEYYKEIPIEIYEKAKEFLKDFSLYREWVNTKDKDLIFNSLKEAPLQVTVLYDSGNGYLNPTSNTGIKWNHAVMLYGAEYGKYWMIFDHYEQVYKKYAWDYEFGAILKPTLTKKDNYMFKKDHAYQLVQGDGQLTALYVEDVVIKVGEPAITGLLIGNSIDVIINSSMRLKEKNLITPEPTTLDKWNSVEHYNMKGESI